MLDNIWLEKLEERSAHGTADSYKDIIHTAGEIRKHGPKAQATEESTQYIAQLL